MTDPKRSDSGAMSDAVVPLAQFLFHNPGPDGHVLFDSTADLARELTQGGTSEGYEPGQVDTLQSMLPQVLRGVRGCPEKLKLEIQNAVERRLAQRNQQGAAHEWRRRTEHLIDDHNLRRGAARALDAEVLFYELLMHSDAATDQFVVTAEPAELIGSERADSLERILRRRLGLNSSSAGDPTARYTFCLPSVEVARAWWMALLVRVAGLERRLGDSADASTLPEEDACARLQSLDEEGRLRVLVIDRAITACAPCVVFNPNGTRAAGYTLYWHGRESVSVAKMDEGAMRSWTRDVYLPIASGELRSERVRWRRPGEAMRRSVGGG